MFKKRTPITPQDVEDTIIASLASESFFQATLDVMQQRSSKTSRRQLSIHLMNAIGKAADETRLPQMQVAQSICAKLRARLG